MTAHAEQVEVNARGLPVVPAVDSPDDVRALQEALAAAGVSTVVHASARLDDDGDLRSWWVIRHDGGEIDVAALMKVARAHRFGVRYSNVTGFVFIPPEARKQKRRKA